MTKQQKFIYAILILNLTTLGGTWLWAPVITTASILMGVILWTQSPLQQTHTRALGFLFLLTMLTIGTSVERLVAIEHSAWAFSLFTLFILSRDAYTKTRTTDLAQHLTWFGLFTLGIVWSHHFFDATASFGFFQPTADPQYATLPIVNPNHLAALLVLLIPLGFRLRAQPNRTLGFLLFTVALFTMAFFNTITGLILGLSAALYTYTAKKPHLRRSTFSVVLLCIVLFVLFSENISTQSLRVQQLSDVRPLFLERPFFGVGLGNFATAFEPFRTDTLFRSLSHLHNDPIELLVEIGLVGTVLLLAVLVPILRNIRSESIKLSFILLALFSLVEFPMHLPIVSLTAALLLGAGQPDSVPQQPTKRWPLVVILSTALLITTHQALTAHAVKKANTHWLTLLDPSHPTLLIHNAESAIKNSTPTDAVQKTNQLFSQHGQRAKWAHASASLYEQLGMKEEARIAMKQATVRAPANKQHHFGLAALLHRDGRSAEALASYSTGICHDANSDELAVALNAHPIPLHWLATVEACHPRLLLPLAKLLENTHPYLALAALDSSPNTNHNLHAKLLARTEQLPKALELLRGLGHDSVTLRTTLVRLLFNDQQYQAAIEAAAPSVLSGTASPAMLLITAKAHHKMQNNTLCAKILNAPENRNRLSSVSGSEVAILRDTCQRQ